MYSKKKQSTLKTGQKRTKNILELDKWHKMGWKGDILCNAMDWFWTKGIEIVKKKDEIWISKAKEFGYIRNQNTSKNVLKNIA